MTIEAKVIQDSVSPDGVRLVTMQLKYPRIIHAEFQTHRVFSRNASSSRAIPVNKIIQEVIDNPAKPVVWGKNEPGMQAYANFEGVEAEEMDALWLLARDKAVVVAQNMARLGAHKQVVNRILEPFAHISVIVTATEWDNFFALRDHKAADPTIHALAIAMKEAMSGNYPMYRGRDEYFTENWHLPYISNEERIEYKFNPHFLAKISTARVARVSYLNHDGTEPDIQKDLALYDRLVGSEPLHASPTEAIAYPAEQAGHWYGNFRGWHQFRKLVESGKV